LLLYFLKTVVSACFSPPPPYPTLSSHLNHPKTNMYQFNLKKRRILGNPILKNLKSNLCPAMIHNQSEAED
jgi:hypothetical protein